MTILEAEIYSLVLYYSSAARGRKLSLLQRSHSDQLEIRNCNGRSKARSMAATSFVSIHITIADPCPCALRAFSTCRA